MAYNYKFVYKSIISYDNTSEGIARFARLCNKAHLEGWRPFKGGGYGLAVDNDIHAHVSFVAQGMIMRKQVPMDYDEDGNPPPLSEPPLEDGEG